MTSRMDADDGNIKYSLSMVTREQLLIEFFSLFKLEIQSNWLSPFPRRIGKTTSRHKGMKISIPFRRKQT